MTKTTLRKLKEALLLLPEGLSETYDETLRRVDAQSSDQARLARKALYWVFYASRPLTMVELQHALAVEVGERIFDEDNIPDEGLVLSVCNGLLTYQKEGGFLSLVHYTFQEYLELKAKSLFPEAELEIVRTGLTYLSFNEFEKGPCSQDHEFKARLRQWPLLQYVVFEWGQHARGSVEEHCKDLIMSFLSHSEKLSASIQVLCVREAKGLGYSLAYPKQATALWLASFHGLEAIAAFLISGDKDAVLAKTNWGDTALHRAAGCGHARVVEILLEHGADPGAKDKAGNTPLHLATLFRGAHAISTQDIFSSTLLENRGRMVQRVRTLIYSLEVKQLLLNHGADANATNLKGNSALHLAVCDGHQALSRLLLDGGADVTLRDRIGLAPLSIASECGLYEVTGVLLEYDLESQIGLDIVDDALRRAVLKDKLSLLQLLISKVGKQSPVDDQGRTLLHMASFRSSIRCLELLTELGYDLHAPDKQGRTCLHHAAAGQGGAVKFLLNHGLDPNHPDIDGWTPLFWAAKGGCIRDIQLLSDATGIQNGGNEWIPFTIAMFHEVPDLAALLRPPNQDLPKCLDGDHLTISLRQPRVICDGCELVSDTCAVISSSRARLTFLKYIFGTRHKCLVCPDFDYCFKCVRSASATHLSHGFEVIYRSRRGRGIPKEVDPERIEKIKSREAMITTGVVSVPHFVSH